MKLKILVIPLVLTVIVGMIIWAIVPAFQEVREKNQFLNSEKKKIVDIQEKEQSVERLNQELSGSVEPQNILLEYVPLAGKEEEIIDNLNYIASNPGLLVSNISLAVGKNNDASLFAAPAGGPSEDISKNERTASNGLASGSNVGTKTPVLKNIEVNFEAAGKYESIKAALEKMSKLKRFNDVSSLKIDKMESLTGEESTPDNLQVKMKLIFNYLEKINSVISIDNQIFSDEKFNFSIVDEIKDKTNVDILKLNPGSAGRTNPFIP